MANQLILIIEHNEVNRVLVRDMLRFKGGCGSRVWPTGGMTTDPHGRGRCADVFLRLVRAILNGEY